MLKPTCTSALYCPLGRLLASAPTPLRPKVVVVVVVVVRTPTPNYLAVPRWVLNGQKQGGTACLTLSWSMCGVKVPIERIGGREGV